MAVIMTNSAFVWNGGTVLPAEFVLRVYIPRKKKKEKGKRKGKGKGKVNGQGKGKEKGKDKGKGKKLWLKCH